MVEPKRLKASAVGTLVAVIILWAAAAAVDAADYWVDGGLGGSSIGVSGGAGYSSVAGSRVLSVRALVDFWGKESGWSLLDLGVLYGLASREGNGGIVALSAGIGLTRAPQKRETGQTWGITYSSSSGESVSTVGLLLQLQIFGRSGLGLKAFGNVNSEQSFGGLLLCLRVGRFR